MTQLTLDANALAKFRGVTTAVQVCDEKGCIIGYFRPAAGVQRYPEPPQLAPEELQQRLAEPGGRSISEVLTVLESRM